MSDDSLTPGRLAFILGGARSGKSRFAQQRALESGGKVVYFATGVVTDDEMQARIAKHRASRPEEWTTVEEPLLPQSCIVAVRSSHEVAILDCLTVYTTNLMLQPDPPEDEAILAAVESTVRLMKQSFRETYVVSNEVGLGIVPDTELSRRFRDLAGLANQRVAALAEAVYFMCAGLSVRMKGCGISDAE